MTATIETRLIRKWGEEGAYGFTFDFAAVEHRGELYLLIDSWCGGDIEGQCPRPHLYLVPAALREEVLEVFRPGWDEMEEIDGGYYSDAIGFNAVTLPKLELGFRASRAKGHLKQIQAATR